MIGRKLRFNFLKLEICVRCVTSVAGNLRFKISDIRYHSAEDGTELGSGFQILNYAVYVAAVGVFTNSPWLDFVD
ncbi:MAG: hypothetical protein J0M18_13675 [Ignavibacteria bacterium]|nr:hypothetical protein [Ignavibacteria bacterium]